MSGAAPRARVLAHATPSDLASSRQLSDPAFVSYLAYLRYWLAPEYARFIAFPFALFFLEQVQSSAFRERLLLDPGFVALLVKQTESHWRFFRLNRTLSTPQIKEQPAP